jgi:hypothetical protein
MRPKASLRLQDFGLAHTDDGGWEFEGAVEAGYQSVLVTPHDCMDLVEALVRQADIKHLCVMSDDNTERPLILVLDAPGRPLAIVTGVEGTAESAAAMSAEAAKRSGGKITFHEDIPGFNFPVVTLK